MWFDRKNAKRNCILSAPIHVAAIEAVITKLVHEVVQT